MSLVHSFQDLLKRWSRNDVWLWQKLKAENDTIKKQWSHFIALLTHGFLSMTYGSFDLLWCKLYLLLSWPAHS